MGAVILGRKTWDSLSRNPLPNRLNSEQNPLEKV